MASSLSRVDAVCLFPCYGGLAGTVLAQVISTIEYRSLPAQTTLRILLHVRKFCIELYVDINLYI